MSSGARQGSILHPLGFGLVKAQDKKYDSKVDDEK